MSITIIILLILLGILFLLAELLLVSGSIAVGVIGVVFIITGIAGAFHSHGTNTGLIVCGITFSVCGIIIYYLMKSKTWKKFTLNSTIDSKVNVIDESKVKTGDSGKTLSKVGPIGKAQFNGYIFEVRSLGEYIEENKEIMVVKIEANRIFVALKN